MYIIYCCLCYYWEWWFT